MSDKHLSGEEKRKKMKEEIKKDLRTRKEFLSKVKNLRQQNKIVKALNEMDVEDDTDDWIRKLDEETAFTEAKMEIAMEEVASEKMQEDIKSEEEMKKMFQLNLLKKI